MKNILLFLLLFSPLAYSQEVAGKKIYSKDVEAAFLQYQNTKDKGGIVRITPYHLLAYKKDGIHARVEPFNASLLHVAAQAGAPDLVSALLEAGLEPDVEASDLQTPLHWAAAGGNLVSSEILLTAEANPDASDNNKRTPLWMAAYHGNTATCQLLLNFDANPAIKGMDPDTASAYTPYRIAQTKGHKETAALIYSAGGR